MFAGDTILWLNGSFVPLSRAGVSPLDRGLLYGDGIFTTLRAQEGRPLHLGRHLQRLSASARALNLEPDRTGAPVWPEIVGRLLELNGLTRGAARVKLMITRGTAQEPGLPESPRPTLMALAEPYQPPGPEQYAAGWRLMICRQGHAPPLAGHKTLNYLYFMLARQMALDAGCHEAVILGPGGEITETSSGSLLARSGGQWWTPESPYQLPGVTLGLVSAMLAGRGQPVAGRQARPEDLMKADTVWVLGSLMGVMPVAAVGDRLLPESGADLAADIRGRLLEGV